MTRASDARVAATESTATDTTSSGSSENPRAGRAPPSAIGGEGAGRAPRRPRAGQRRRRLGARHRRGGIRDGPRLLRGVRRQTGSRRGHGPQPGGTAACAHRPRRCRALSTRQKPARRGGHEPLSVEELSRGVEHRERPGRERHPVLATRLHALGRDLPRRRVAVDLLPPGVAHLARARGGELRDASRSPVASGPVRMRRAAAATASQHRVQRGAANISAHRLRPPPIARRCASARAPAPECPCLSSFTAWRSAIPPASRHEPLTFWITVSDMRHINLGNWPLISV